MTTPYFNPKWIKLHKTPLWVFRLLAFFGLAKYYMGVDIAMKKDDYSALVAGYWVAGTFYITENRMLSHQQSMEIKFFGLKDYRPWYQRLWAKLRGNK